MLFYQLTLLSQALTAPDGTPQKPPVISLQTIILIAGFMLVIFIMMRSTARKTALSRSKSGQSYKDIVKSQLKENPYHTIERLEELMAALADMSREINGQIDTRTAKLEILINQADNKLRQYRELVNEEKDLRNSPNNYNISQPPATMEIPAGKSNNPRERFIPDNVPGPSDMAGHIDLRVTDQDLPTEPEPVPEKPNRNNQTSDKDRILGYAREGLSLSEISRLTGRPSGEIELILNLSGYNSRK